jgi:DUF4097 and DUF4098 domain-containing protein YvlB
MYFKNNSFIIVLIISFLFVCSNAMVGYAASAPTDKAEVPLSNPGKPAQLKVSIITGSITVTGYNGKSVVVEATAKMHEDDDDDDEDRARKKNTKGMFRITNKSTGLKIVEENNLVVVQVTSYNRRIDLNIKVPYKTSMKLRSVNSGFIKVTNVEGDLDVSHTNGPLTLTKVSGTVVANTINGDVEVSFEKVNLAKPMAITSFNGDVLVTFPANAKFNLNMQSNQGEIYSDFKLDIKAQSSQQKKAEKKGGKYQIQFDKGVLGLLNGGGEAVKLKTFNGDILIKKKK